MIVDIPDGFVDAVWGAAIAGIGVITAIFVGIKNKNIPLSWGKPMSCITREDLLEHCSNRHDKLSETFHEFNSSLKEITDVLMDVRERLARIEGREGA
jgi:hypothetical protein